MRKFRAGCKIQSIAAEMRSKVKFYWQLPQHLKSMVDAVASVLGQTRKDVFKSVRNSKKAQKVNGKRLVVLNELAGVYNKAGGGKTGVAAVEKEKRKLSKLKSSLIDDSLAIEMIKNTAAAQGGLVLLSQLAGVYNATEGNESDKLLVVEGDDRLEILMKSYKIDDKAKAIEMVKNTAAAQIRNGQSLVLLGQLASIYNSTEGNESDKLAVIEGDIRLNDLMKAYKIDDMAKAIEMVKNTAAAQGGLALLPQLASIYNSTKGNESVKEAVVKEDDRLEKLMKLYKIDDMAKAIEMIKKTAAAQIDNGDRIKITNKLARKLNEAGGVGAGDRAVSVVTSDKQFETLTALLGGTEEAKEDAIEAIKKVAKETDTTWCSRYNELVRRFNDKSDDSVSIYTVDDNGHDVEVLYVRGRNKEGEDIRALHDWWAEQVNLPSRVVGEKYAVQAWRMKGSLYYLALKELSVSFDERREDNLNLNMKAAIAALDERRDNADMNRDNAAVDALRGAEFNSNIGVRIREEED